MATVAIALSGAAAVGAVIYSLRGGKSPSPQLAGSVTPKIVYYWGPKGGMNMYGRAIGIYLTLNQAGVTYEMKGPSERPEYAGYQVPVIEFDDGSLMAQTPAILTVLGELYGLSGKTPHEKMASLQSVEDMNDMFSAHSKMVDDEALKNKWFTFLEKKLEGKKWLAGGDEPTIADFHGVFAFEWINKKKIDYSKYPKTTQWWADICSYPVVADMLASCVDGRSMIP